MPTGCPHYPQRHDFPDPAKDARIEPHRLIAAAVVRQALVDVVSADRIVRRRYQADAVAFLRGEDGALDWWIDVLGSDERQVRELIARTLGMRDQT